MTSREAAGETKSAPNKADYEAAKKDYTEKKAAYDKALEAYNKAKEDQAAAEKTFSDATADAAGLKAFYAQKVKDATAKVAETKKAAEEADANITAKKNALTEAQAAAAKAASDYQTAVDNQTDKKIQTYTTEVNSLNDVLTAARSEYQSALAHATSNETTLTEISENNTKMANAATALGSKGTTGTANEDGYKENATGLYGQARELLATIKTGEAATATEAEKKAAAEARTKLGTKGTTDGNTVYGKIANNEATLDLGKENATKANKIATGSSKTVYVNTVGGTDVDAVTAYKFDEATATYVIDDAKTINLTQEAIKAEKDFTYEGTYSEANAAGTATTKKTANLKIGEVNSTDTSTWYGLYNTENKKLNNQVASNKDLAALKADLDTKNAAVTTAQTELTKAQQDSTSAYKAYNDAVAAEKKVKAEQDRVKNYTDDQAKALAKHSVDTLKSEDEDNLPTLAAAKQDALDKAAATAQARIDKTDAQEAADLASDKLTRAKAAYEKTKASVKVSKPKIGIKRYGKKAVRITWTKSTNAARYQVKVRRAGKGYGWKTYYTNGKRSKIVKGLKSGKKYYAKVRGISKNGTKGTYSNTVSIRVK